MKRCKKCGFSIYDDSGFSESIKDKIHRFLIPIRKVLLSKDKEYAYVKKMLLNCYDSNKDCYHPFENFLIRIVPYPRKCIYVEIKSRKCGYIFGYRRSNESKN